jgi:RNA polymerase sigma-54 factor
MLGQRLSQKMLQKLSPQQIQLMKLLQVPTSLLEQRIKEEMEINPALEENPNDFDHQKEDLAEPQEIKDNDEEYEEQNSSEEDDFGSDLDITEYTKDDYDYNDDDSYSNHQEDKKQRPLTVGKSFHDFLTEQLALQEGISEHEYLIADHLIGSLDDDGYLRRDIEAIIDDLAFQRNITTNQAEIERLLRHIQRFDPAGVGARNLQECLLIQLERKKQTKNVEKAIEIITRYFDAFTKKHYDKLAKALNIDDEQLKAVLDEILHLNPKPGGTGSSSAAAYQTIIPDFTVEEVGGKLEVYLNGKNAPDLRISDSFREMLQSYSKGNIKDKKNKEAVTFIKQKIDAAKWFIDAIKQRQHTLFVTMEAIVQFQEKYFFSGSEMDLRPMILKDIAEMTGLDISTVSRVANSKYVQTEFGIFLLKYFFSESLQTESGEEVSTREVKKILQDIIDAEDKLKPQSDEDLTDLLKERGYNIARRTVAKYREQLNIPVARLRKEL